MSTCAAYVSCTTVYQNESGTKETRPGKMLMARRRSVVQYWPVPNSTLQFGYTDQLTTLCHRHRLRLANDYHDIIHGLYPYLSISSSALLVSMPPRTNEDKPGWKLLKKVEQDNIVTHYGGFKKGWFRYCPMCGPVISLDRFQRRFVFIIHPQIAGFQGLWSTNQTDGMAGIQSLACLLWEWCEWEPSGNRDINILQ